MCTAATYQSKDFYFGRTLDNEFSYGEKVVVMPRNYPLHYLEQSEQVHHYAIIGMASIMEGVPLFYDAVNEHGLAIAGLNFVGNACYHAHQDNKDNIAQFELISIMEGVPLFYDAVNEHGLAIAGLNFVGNACYHAHQDNKDNIAQFELIPWLLSQCTSVEEAKPLLQRMNILNIPFRPQLPLAQLHWIIADQHQTITVESVEDGLKIYDNPLGVLTNNPPFPMQMQHLTN